MRYALIDWTAQPPSLVRIKEFDTAPQGIRLENGNPVLIPVDEATQPAHDPQTQRVETTIQITPAAYVITHNVIDLTDEEIEARMVAAESATDGRLINRLLRQQVDPEVIPPDEIDEFASLFPVWRFNFHAYVIGDIVQYEGAVYQAIQAHSSQPDWSPPVVPALWVRLAEPGNPEWTAGVAYAVNDEVTYLGVEYRCLQAHTAQVGWEPPNVPALWQVIV